MGKCRGRKETFYKSIIEPESVHEWVPEPRTRVPDLSPLKSRCFFFFFFLFLYVIFFFFYLTFLRLLLFFFYVDHVKVFIEFVTIMLLFCVSGF